MNKPFLLDLLKIIVAFACGMQLIKVNWEGSFAGVSYTEEVDFAIKRLIFLFLGIGLIGYGLTKSLLRIKEFFTTKKKMNL